MKLPEGVSEVRLPKEVLGPAGASTLIINLSTFDSSHLSDDDMADVIKGIVRNIDTAKPMVFQRYFWVKGTPKMRALLGKGMDQCQ